MITKTNKILLLAMVLATACGAPKFVAMTQADADRAATKFPEATLTSLQQGQQLYKDNCGKCHGLKKTTWGNEAQWKEIIPPMSKEAQIDAKTENLITQYLLTACYKP